MCLFVYVGVHINHIVYMYQSYEFIYIMHVAILCACIHNNNILASYIAMCS